MTTLSNESVTAIVEVLDVTGVFVKAAYDLEGERREFVVPVPEASELAVGDRFRITVEELTPLSDRSNSG